MFTIDLRNKLVSNFCFSVINNNNVDKVWIFSHFVQYSNYNVYLKVISDDETYVDKIKIDSENIAVEDDALVVTWTMGLISTQCKKIALQLQFEDDDGNYVAQSRIFTITLADTIDVSKESKHIYPDIFKVIDEEIKTLQADSVAKVSGSYLNDIFSVNFYNVDDELVGNVQFSIPTGRSFISISFDDATNNLILTNNNGIKTYVDLSTLNNLTNYYTKSQTDAKLNLKLDKDALGLSVVNGQLCTTYEEE